MTNNNNGTAEESCPYLASNIKSYLINTVYPKLPNDVKSVISDKKTMVEERYLSNQILNETPMWKRGNLGKIWIPSESELAGCVIWGSKNYSDGGQVQYPLFANSWKHRIKKHGKGSVNNITWWLTIAVSGHTNQSTIVYIEGYISRQDIIKFNSFPICFRA